MNIDTFVAGIQNQDLRIPSSHYDAVRRFTMTRTNDEGAKDPDQSPFNRYVDLWWVSVCIGAQENKRTTAAEWHTFVRAGEVLPTNPWRILQLQLLGLGLTGSTEILHRPSELITLANELAATGLPLLIEEMTGKGIPIWAVTDFLKERGVFSVDN